MTKYYNKNVLCNELVELTNHLSKKNCGEMSVSQLIATLLSLELTLTDISSKTGFNLEHILQLDKETSNEILFTVWVGGTEVNEHLLSLNKGFELHNHWKNEGYDDTSIGGCYS